jgi:type IV secretory pathway VirB2 component (pilin)
VAIPSSRTATLVAPLPAASTATPMGKRPAAGVFTCFAVLSHATRGPTVSTAALVGANGLGVPAVRALNSVNTALGFESGIIIVVVAAMLDRMLRVTRK